MNTEILTLSQIARAVELLKAGELVAFPTETVYGLGAALFNEKAIQKIFAVKGRPSDNPLIVHIAKKEDAFLVASHVSHMASLLIEAFFPGPLTLVLPRKKNISSLVTANLDTVALRMPAHPFARTLIELLNEPVVAPSANLSGKPSATSAEHVLEDFNGKIAAMIDGGKCALGIESTVIRLEPKPSILRPGSIRAEEIEEVLKQKVEYYTKEGGEAPLAPGMKYRHYAPRAPVKLFLSEGEFQAFLAGAPFLKRLILSSFDEKQLYALFRKADQMDYEEILVLCTEEMRSNHALMNRLMKSTEA
jgi:L-threonylcarbamoyladenylate synthase